MSQWNGSLYCETSDGLYLLRQDVPARTANVIEASGPQVLPLPTRPLNEQQLADWFSAWRRAGYEFRKAG